MRSGELEFHKIYRLTGAGRAIRAETWHGCIQPSQGSVTDELKCTEQLRIGLCKARSGEYDGLLLVHDWLLRADAGELATQIREQGATPIVSLPFELLRTDPTRFNELQKRARHLGCHPLYLITQNADLCPEALALLSHPELRYHVLSVLTRSLDLEKLLAWSPPTLQKRIRLYVPHFAQGDPTLFTTEEVFQTLERAKAHWPEFKPHALRGLEIFDPRIPSDLDLEPLQQPLCEVNRIMNPEVTFVIPAYNNGHHLVQTLAHLERQETPAGLFEVIVVDDGSSDGTLQLIRSFVESTRLPLTFLHLPRTTPREMGDNRFRAGIARNLGVKHAKGALLQFLDCDILVGRDFTRSLLHAHAQGDIVQAKRLQLTPEATLSRPRHENIVEGRDTYVPPGAYWETFQDTTTDWNALPAHWKYVSSFCLSVKTAHFKQAGWFKKVHAWYGFEDTDLGLRLLGNGCKLHLSSSRVYHLYHRDERSEWGHSLETKKALLSRTCKIFYHHHLDPRIFNELRVFMA